MIFGKRNRASQPGEGSSRLAALVREHLPDADEDTQRVVVAVTGLLACVAYADREYSEAERDHVEEALTRVEGLGRAGTQAICALLDAHIVEVASSNTQAYTRTLRELADVELRREVLDVLVDLAAADDDLSLSETDLLRRTTAALGLEHQDYLAAQSRHRERLSVLK